MFNATLIQRDIVRRPHRQMIDTTARLNLSKTLRDRLQPC
jgi:hypothetical protein